VGADYLLISVVYIYIYILVLVTCEVTTTTAICGFGMRPVTIARWLTRAD
jgi:hypothetical protein